MSENKKLDVTHFIPASGYLFTQSGMLLAEYGLKLGMPNWATWFPSIIVGGLIGVGLVGFLIWLLCTLIIAIFKWWRG
ncbi:MAG: hypothetical protein Q7K45_07230 [Nanoarchaeota archaeon]|nr:hypothetical protein [Nanoarchaeota archaeon]